MIINHRKSDKLSKRDPQLNAMMNNVQEANKDSDEKLQTTDQKVIIILFE